MAKISTLFLFFPLCFFAQEPQDILLAKHFTIHSKVLNQDCFFNVRLPENYSATAAYPVILLLDGSMEGDFLPFCGLAHNASYPWIQQMPPSIIVGVENQDRKHDFTFPTSVAEDKQKYPTTGHSAEWISYVKNELLPWIDQHYRVTKRTLVGQSLGGLVSAEILLTYPNLFDMYVLISPSLWWDNQSLLQKLPSAGISDQQVFVSYGSEEADFMEEPVQKLCAGLEAKVREPAKIVCRRIEAATHANILIPALLLAFDNMDWYFGEKK